MSELALLVVGAEPFLGVVSAEGALGFGGDSFGELGERGVLVGMLLAVIIFCGGV